MDKNKLQNKQSTINEKRSFLKKDGLYVVLFLCLCIVAGVATYVNTTIKERNSSLSKQVSKTQTNENNNSATKGNKTSDNKVAKGSQNQKSDMQNADLVKKDATKNPDSVSTNATVQNNTMVSPVNGTIALGYTGTDGSMAVGLDKVSRTILGEYIKVSSKGIPVYASMTGTIFSVDGGRVVILSKDNKLKVVCDNLEPTSITLKKGDVVTQNNKIGVVGDSDNAKERIVDCDHLYFEVDEKQNDGTYKDVNPQNYIKY